MTDVVEDGERRRLLEDVPDATLLTPADVAAAADRIAAAREAAAELLTAGPRVVALGAGSGGDLVAWRAGPRLGVAAEEPGVDPAWGDDDVLVPLLGGRPVDATGAGDPFVATLTAALLGGAGPGDAAWAAAAAACSTVAHAGGRPDLSPGARREVIRRHRPM